MPVLEPEAPAVGKHRRGCAVNAGWQGARVAGVQGNGEGLYLLCLKRASKLHLPSHFLFTCSLFLIVYQCRGTVLGPAGQLVLAWLPGAERGCRSCPVVLGLVSLALCIPLSSVQPVEPSDTCWAGGGQRCSMLRAARKSHEFHRHLAGQWCSQQLPLLLLLLPGPAAGRPPCFWGPAAHVQRGSGLGGGFTSLVDECF